MRILLDECLPRPLKKLLTGHECITARERGWDGKRNGELLRLAEQEFDIFLTVDRRLPSQQNMGQFQIAAVILIVRDNRLQTIEPLVAEMLQAFPLCRPGEVVRIGG
jgi:predicted nuclease of predicted toxin-antitoxin system